MNHNSDAPKNELTKSRWNFKNRKQEAKESEEENKKGTEIGIQNISY
jgi:hypothetical protein